jgi:hypothetical protein
MSGLDVKYVFCVFQTGLNTPVYSVTVYTYHVKTFAFVCVFCVFQNGLDTQCIQCIQ